MKNILNNIPLLFLLFAFAFPMQAQNIYQGQITVNPRELSQKGESLEINIDVDFSGLVMDRDHSLMLKPILVSAEKETELPYILINGSKRHKVYNRKMALNKKLRDQSGVFKVVKAEPNTDMRLNYSLSIPFEDWMEYARLDLKQDICGCANVTRQIAIDKMIATVLMEGEARYEVKPLLSYIRPEVEEIKRRSEQRDAFLDFQVGKAVIVPTYMNNPRELDKIESMLQEVRDDKNLTVSSVAIKGYASPEGNVSFNNKLSSGRAESLRSFLASRSAFPSHVYQVEQGGEDWDGLEKLVEESFIDNKNEILNVIRSGKTEDAREQALKSVAGGSVYPKILKELFPQLRRVLCRVDYTVRGFNEEEAKKVIMHSPKQLSLEEMFLVANSYKTDEPEFLEVFETAVRLYPDNEVANLNAAASALQWRDTERAKRYLDKANPSTNVYVNNLGVYYLLVGEFDKARDLFTRAVRNGVPHAEHNLQELDRKIEIEGL